MRNSCVSIEYFYKSFEYVIEELFDRIYLQEKGIVLENYLDTCYFERVLSRLNKVINYNMLEEYGFSNFIAKMMKEGCKINGVYQGVMKHDDYLKQYLRKREPFFYYLI